MSRYLFVPSICLSVLLNAAIAFAEDPGSRPVNVAVSPDGNTILATSMGSNSMTEAKWNGSTYVLSSPKIAVGYPSWGLVFVDANTVVVTHPAATALSVLTRTGAGDSFAKTDEIELGSQFRYSTELIHVPGTSSVLVANRGMPLNGQPSWTNALYQVDLMSEQITASVLTEREPRALAISPGPGCRLFVGHIQGPVGGAPLATNHPDADNYEDGDFIGDGGSVLVYNNCLWPLSGTLTPMNGERIGVGSPVRGIAVSGNADGSYVVYYTSVGNQANSEDPTEGAGDAFFGGRQIPNVITALYYNSSSVLDSMACGVFDHQPDWFPGTNFSGMMGRPAILPDKLVVRDITVEGQRTRELFVTNSGSGTLSRTPLDTNGRLRFSTDPPVFLTHAKLTRVPGEIRDITVANELNVKYKKLLVVTNAGENVSHVDLSRGQPLFTSNTRAVAYDPAKDHIWVATQFDNELIRVTATDNATGIAQRLPFAGVVGSGGERNFFGFGRGFAFREVDTFAHDPVAAVGTQTCATCHVDAHTDGKIRLTKRVASNRPPNESSRKPVAVPSCFDVLPSEWLFFEGLKTVADGQFSGEDLCNYCNQAGFFDDTEEFTSGLASPRSPHNWAGTLGGNTLRGRHLFEAMNCSRCHMGVPQPFTRTIDPEVNPEVAVGPLPTATNRVLSDPTQVFLTFAVVDNLSHRNMTDVGTRLPGDGRANGINTPGLAGLWDNRPYMHDGRYRTLDEALENTWLENAPAFRAAPLVLHPDVPDNARDTSIDDMSPVTALHEFKTHQHGSPGGTWTSVASKLSPTDYAALKAFLLSLSSETDPCEPEPDFVLNLMVLQSGVVKCSSPVKIQCRFDWDGPTPWSHTTAWGTLHASSPPPGAEDGTYIVTVTPLVRPVCGSPDIEAIQVNIPGGPELTQRGDLPKITEMAPCTPNPFNPSTTIGFSLAKEDHVSILVFDAAGRVVRTLVDEHRRPDRYAVVWDGSDNRGAPVASGVYFCRMAAGSYQSTQKLVLLK